MKPRCGGWWDVPDWRNEGPAWAKPEVWQAHALSTQKRRAEGRGESWAVGRDEAAQALESQTSTSGACERQQGKAGLHSACNNEPLKVLEKADAIRSLI